MEIVKLGEIIMFKAGKKPKPLSSYVTDNSKDIPWIKISDINNNKLIKTKTFFRKSEINKTKLIEKDSLLMTSEGTVGITFINKIQCAIDNHIFHIEPGNKIIKEYLYYWLIKNKNKIKSLQTGSVLQSISRRSFFNMKIFLPNTEQQQAIIDIIEPFEKTFLKFKDLVRIDTVENCKKDISLLIDIIEPFEEEKYIRENINRTLLELIKNDNANNKLSETITLNDLVIRTKKKNTKNYTNVIDLSSINNDSLTLFSFKKTSDFSSNIFETKEGDMFLSSIRPSLKKYGISPFNMNILGTLFNFRPLIYENRGLVLSCISSNDFQNFLIQSSEGTKMPIVKWDKFKNYKFNKISNDKLHLFNNIFDLIKLNNKILNALEKILDNLIELHIK